MSEHEVQHDHEAGRETPETRRHPYITRRKDTCRGKPIIVGTRIKVEQIATEYERMGWTPDEIIQAHPHLTLAQIHDALSYYYENVEVINQDIRKGERFVEEYQKAHPDSVLDMKRGVIKNLSQSG